MLQDGSCRSQEGYKELKKLAKIGGLRWLKTASRRLKTLGREFHDSVRTAQGKPQEGSQRSQATDGKLSIVISRLCLYNKCEICRDFLRHQLIFAGATCIC